MHKYYPKNTSTRLRTVSAGGAGSPAFARICDKVRRSALRARCDFFSRLVALSIAASALFASPAYADDIYWANPVNGFFNTPANWVGNRVPASADITHLNAYASGVPAYTITFANNVTNAGLAVTALSTNVIVNLNSHIWTQSTSASNPLSVDGNSGTQFTLENGTMVTNDSSGQSNIGTAASNSGQVLLSNATWNHTGTLALGLNGYGSISVDANSSMTENGLVAIGANAGSTGFMGSSGTVNINTTEEHVGQYGVGALYLTGGTYTVAQNLLFGVYAGSNGAADIYRGTLTSNGGYEFVGFSGQGTMEVEAQGTQQVNGNLIIGNDAGAFGTEILGYSVTINVAQPNSSIPASATSTATSVVTGAEIVGQSATGNLGNYGTILAYGATYTQLSGTSTVGSLTLANAASATALYTMAGGVLNVNSGSLVVGEGGRADFNQSAGTVTIIPTLRGIIVGDSALSSGSYSLSGTGIINVPFLVVGNGGAAIFTVAGGNLSANNFITVGSGSSPGVFNQTGGTATSTSLVIGPHGIVTLNGGTLTITGNITNNGTFRQFPGSTLNLSGSFQTNGSATFIAGMTFNGTTQFTVQSGSTTFAGTVAFGSATGSNAGLTLTGGTVTINGTLGIGNDGTLTGGGSGVGALSITNATLTAHQVILGNTNGGSGTVTLNSGGLLKAAGLSANDATVNGGTLEIDPQALTVDDPEIQNALVGGYKRDGALNVYAGAVTSPTLKLGVTAGKTGTYTQTGGNVTVTTLGVGNDASSASGAGTGHVTISGGTLNASHVYIGSTTGGVGDLMLTNTGQLNLAGFLILHSSNLTADTTTYRTYLANHQIISTGAANTGLGLVSGADYLALNGPAATFDSQTVVSSDLLIRLTYLGDATLDGAVTIADYLQIDAAFLHHTPDPSWLNGDFNQDGVVDYKDYALIDYAYQHQSGGTLAADMIAQHAAEFGAPYLEALAGVNTPIPEPASLAILALGIVPLFHRHGRQYSRSPEPRP